MFRKIYFLNQIVVVLALSFGVVGPANAIVIELTGQSSGGDPGGLPIYKATIDETDVGNSFDMNWSHVPQAGVEVSGTSTWTVNGFTDSLLTLGVSISNTTTGVDRGGINSLGLSVDPMASSVDVSGSTFFESSGFDFVPGFNRIVDICTWTSNNCRGGGQGSALPVNMSDAFTLTIGGDFNDGAGGLMVMLDAFAAKFQTNVGSYQLPGAPIPIPAAVWLFGSSLGLLGLVRRKQRNDNIAGFAV